MKKQNHKNLRSQAGFTLAELIIVILMGTILTIGISVAVVNYIRSTATNIGVGEVQSQLRAALDYVAQDLRQARYIYRPPGTNCPTDLLTSVSTLHYNTCPVDVTSNKYVLPAGIGGAQITVKPLTGNDLAGVDRKARIVLAMWVPVTKGAYGTSNCNKSDADYKLLPDGELLSVDVNYWYPAVPPSSTWTCKPIGFGNTKATGTLTTRPAYMLVVYLTQGIGSDDVGPRVLSRWTSPIVGIDIGDFGKGKIQSSTPATATPSGYIIDPTPLFPSSKGSADDIADYLMDDSNTVISALTYNTLDTLNSRTYDLQIRADLKNLDNPQANNSIGTIDNVTADKNHLMYRTSVVARNVCGGGDGDLASCPEDPTAP